MLDTLILEVSETDYKVVDPIRFQPSLSLVRQRGARCTKSINNPTSLEKKQGLCLPRLTVVRRVDKYGQVTLPLRIEFSAPKIVYGNNVDELREEDFPLFLSSLQFKLEQMRVKIHIDDLRSAKVCVLHLSKNILFQYGISSRYVINQLSKVDLTRKMDLSRTDFRNQGTSLQYYASSHSLVFYDKVKDLSQPRVRAIDKDQAHMDKNIYQKLRKTELLRMEVRLTKAPKMKEILKKVCGLHSRRLEDIFKHNVSQKILLHYWETYVESDITLLSIDDLSFLFTQISSARPKISCKELLMLVGTMGLIEQEGQLFLREQITRLYSYQTWLRYKRQIEEVISKIGFRKRYIDQIWQSLVSLSAYKVTEESLTEHLSLQEG